MPEHDRPTAGEPRQTARDRLVAFATALKQSTIYPVGHPRARQGIAEFVQQLANRARGYDLVLRDGAFHGDGEVMPAREVATRWLADRLRALGLRGLQLEAACTVDDVLEFAAQLRDTRRKQVGCAWPTDHPRLRALPLVFAGEHDMRAAADAASGGAGGFAALPAAVGTALLELRGSDTFQQRLRAIERAASTVGVSSEREVDLLQTIAQLLPEEVAREPQRVTECVQGIVDELTAELERLGARRDRLDAAQLIERATAVARRFFVGTSQQDASPRPPSGRPEDEAIVADVPALMRELATLPQEAANAGRELTASVGRTLGHVALGVHLHLFAIGVTLGATPLATLVELLKKHAAERPQLLDCYLGGGTFSELPPAQRWRLIELLVEAGHAGLVHAQRYVDEALVTGHFPAGVVLAARVLAGDPAGAAVLRQSLAALAPQLATGGVETLRASGALADAAVLRGLLAAGGPEAATLLQTAANANPRLVRNTLLAHLRARPQPDLATLVLRACPENALPLQYVRRLWLACDQGRPDATADAEGAELLLQAMRSDKPLPHADQLAALPWLHLARRRDEVEDLLVRIARAGRFTRWSREARELRRQARRALALLHTTRGR
jgi:hypothetical protein